MEKDYKFERFISVLTDLLLKYGPQVVETQCKAKQSTQEEQK